MIKYIYPSKDATLYELYKARNTGTDQILELTKLTVGQPISFLEDEYEASTFNTRILMQFDLTTISASLVAGKISSDFTASLIINATEAENLSIAYDVMAHAVSGSWDNGTGFYNNDPQITNGVSWQFRSSKESGRIWETGSLAGNVTSSWSTNGGGGVWYTGSGYEASQSFNHELPDIRMDITPIVRTWLSQSIENHGLLIKFPTATELDSSSLGSIKFFSLETHTIYIPRLEFAWDDSEQSGTGSFTEIGSEDYVMSIKNLRESYRSGEIAKIRLFTRSQYPTLTYSTSSLYVLGNRIPTSSYYQVTDVWTEDVIVPFSNGTKLSCDSSGNYFKIDMSSFLPERYYKFQIKSEFEGGNVTKIVDDGFLFKVVR